MRFAEVGEKAGNLRVYIEMLRRKNVVAFAYRKPWKDLREIPIRRRSKNRLRWWYRRKRRYRRYRTRSC